MGRTCVKGRVERIFRGAARSRQLFFVLGVVVCGWELDDAIPEFLTAQERLDARRAEAAADPATHRRATASLDAGEYFARSSEPRRRASPNSDVAFLVGDVVRHTRWGYLAVVLGWDLYAKAPESWAEQNAASQPQESQVGVAVSNNVSDWRIVPNYALLVDARDRPGAGQRRTYVPQTILARAERGTSVMSLALPTHFEGYSVHAGRYIPGQRLAWLYPDDVVTDSASENLVDELLVPRAQEQAGGVAPMFGGSTRGGLQNVAELLLAHRADLAALERAGTPSLHWAASLGDVPLCRDLLALGADPRGRDADDRAPLGVAAANGHVPSMEFLLHQRVEAETCGAKATHPLHLAAASGHVRCVEVLLSGFRVAAACADASGVQAMHRAAQRGHEEVATLLLDGRVAASGAGARDLEGVEPLHVAAERGHLPVVDLLLSRGASPNAAEGSGVTVMHWAAGKGHVDVLHRLIIHGADVGSGRSGGSSLPPGGRRPAHWAAEYGRGEALEFLAMARADVLSAEGEEHGTAPLHLAARGGHSVAVDALLSLRADPGAVDAHGRSPGDVAAAHGHSMLASRLQIRLPHAAPHQTRTDL